MEVVTQKDLSEQIADAYLGKYSVEDIREILKNLEFFVTDNLLHSRKGKPVQIRLFYGLQLNAECIPEHKKIPNWSERGIAITIPEQIKVKAKVTKYFCNKLNDLKESWVG